MASDSVSANAAAGTLPIRTITTKKLLNKMVFMALLLLVRVMLQLLIRHKRRKRQEEPSKAPMFCVGKQMYNSLTMVAIDEELPNLLNKGFNLFGDIPPSKQH